MTKKVKEVEILDEDLDLESTYTTAQEVVWPDETKHNDSTYQGYLGDNVYAD